MQVYRECYFYETVSIFQDHHMFEVDGAPYSFGHKHSLNDSTTKKFKPGAKYDSATASSSESRQDLPFTPIVSDKGTLI